MNGEIVASNFSPLIQLLAGIYLLFVYEAKLHVNPLRRRFDLLLVELDDLYLTYPFAVQNLYMKNVLMANEKFRNEYKIKKIALLMTLFTSFVLLFFGFEHTHFFQNYCYGLLPMGIFLAIFSVIISESKINNTWIVCAFVGAIVLFLINCCFIYFGCSVNFPRYSGVIILSILTCFTGIAVWAYYLLSNFKWIETFRRQIKKTRKKIDYWSEAKFNPNVRDEKYEREYGKYCLNHTNFNLMEFTEEKIKDDIKKLMKKFSSVDAEHHLKEKDIEKTVKEKTEHHIGTIKQACDDISHIVSNMN